MAAPPWGQTDAVAMSALQVKPHVPTDTAILRGKSHMPWQPQSARAEAETNQQAVRVASFNQR